MRNNRCYIFFLITLLYGCMGCSSGKNLSIRYYNENREMLDSIQTRFKFAYNKKPFHIEFKDKNFQYISFEMLSDSFRYIYNFDLQENNFVDTLSKYNYNSINIINLIADMRSIHCTWISNLDYYENQQLKNLVFISVRSNRLKSFLSGEKYYALVYFNEKQFFDVNGRLTDKSQRKRIREINGHLFYKITDKIFYAIIGNFR